jgi:adenylyltransferase/sulfurtransferase
MSRILVIGAGGLGCPALYALGASAHTLSIVDDDVVELSNLNRQILHRSADVGRKKVESARDALFDRWPSATVEIECVRVDLGNVERILGGAEVVLDCTDSFESKFLINDAAVRLGVPLVHGAATRFFGQLMSVIGDSACYRCLFEGPPKPEHARSCNEAGIIGALAGVIGALMADEALAILNGKPELAGVLRVFDGITERRRHIAINRRSSCEAHSRDGTERARRTPSASSPVRGKELEGA